MAEKLTPAQKMAVQDRGGKLLVSAAAGSGKTKVLVDRLLSYLTDRDSPCNIDDFLMITYTKAAAAELRSKIAKKLTELVSINPQSRHLQKQLQRLYLTKISTVHAFCADILRENAYRLDISPDFRVGDERECSQIQQFAMERVLEGAYEKIATDSQLCAFFETQGFGRDDRLVPQIVLQVYHSAQCHLDPDGWLDTCISNTEIGGITDAEQTVWGAYLICMLKRFLDLQIEALSNCVQAASGADGMQKPALLLADTLHQLQHLREANTWDDIISRKNVDYGRLTFPKSCTDIDLINSIKSVRDACKKHLTQKLSYFANDSKQTLNDLNSAGEAARGLVKLVRLFGAEYAMLKNSRRILDFSDLEHRTLDLLLGKKRTGPTATALELGQRFQEIMVDEYQDSNAVQDAIFSALTIKRQNCFMVGDVKQSIYQFRLADPGIFLEKYHTYVHAEEASPKQGRKVLLSSNFRSAGSVIEAVNDVFSNCMSPEVGGLEYGKEEMLHEGIPHLENTEPEVELHAIRVDHDTYAEEAACVAQRIQQLLDGTHMVRDGESFRPIKEEDIVILLRSPGSVGGEFMYALESRGIRCSTGAGLDLLQEEEIVVLRSLLQIISNPLQDISLVCVLTSRVFCFTADDLAQIRASRHGGMLFDALRALGSEKSNAFIQILNQLRYDAKLCTLSELLQKIFSATRMDSIYAAAPDGEMRTANLQAFCQLAAECEANGQRELDPFLEFLTALDEKGLSVGQDQKPAGTVSIMSIHKSKGLEFPVVFLCGLSKGFNQESARAHVLCDRDLGLGLSCVDLKNRVRYPTIAKRAIACKMISDSISEEMRVLYVAMTRARDRLIMTYADKDLEFHLSGLVGRMDFSPKALLTSEVNCAGSWVMLTALRRTESGALFSVSGRPQKVSLKERAWSVRVLEASSEPVDASCLDHQENASLDKATLDYMKTSLDFTYDHIDATHFPSKQTATQLKGRQKDEEVAEDTQTKLRQIRNWRRPSFMNPVESAVRYGNIVHCFMQHVNYQACADIAGINKEIIRMVDAGYLTGEEGELIDKEAIAAFFATELGKKLMTAQNVLREFKFSILDDAMQYGCGSPEEQVLVQGVVDCAVIENGQILVIDFKTDRVTNATIGTVAEQYRQQVALYARALSRIYQMPVHAAWLYFFSANEFIPVI